MARLNEITASRGNRLLLGLALAAGAVAAVLVFVALSSNDDGGSTVSDGPTTSVVVAAQDINAGTVISSDQVKTVEVPADQLISGAVTDMSLVVGEATRVKVYAGEQLIAGKVGAENDREGTAGVVPVGMRGFAMRVSQQTAVSGLLLPGNRVDVYMSIYWNRNNDDPRDDLVEQRMLVQDIEVLSVAQEAQEVGPAAAETDPSGQTATSGQLPDEVDAQPDAATVTLALTSEQVAIMTCAQDNHQAQVWVALRAFGEPSPETHTLWDPCPGLVH